MLAHMQSIRPGVGAFASGICEGGHDTGDGSPCTVFQSGAAGGLSQAEVDAYNATVAANNALYGMSNPLITQASLLASSAADALAANALDAVAPTRTIVTSAPQTNVLNPPTAQSTPTLAQIAAGQTIAGTSALAGSTTLSSATSWLETNWILVAAGVAALLIVPGMMGGKR